MLHTKKKECALISIFDYENGEKLIDFPCLPGKLEELDLNGSGGAFINFDDLNLLTTGTPTKRTDVVRNLAQEDKSPYGKVLEINFDEKKN